MAAKQSKSTARPSASVKTTKNRKTKGTPKAPLAKSQSIFSWPEYSWSGSWTTNASAASDAAGSTTKKTSRRRKAA
jgi:hypothetical protein